jgi:hypothetical protein
VQPRIVDDALPEGPEFLNFTVAPSSAYEIGTPNKVAITIADSDADATNQPAADDSYVRDGDFANKTFGSAADLQVKTDHAGFDRFSYLKFNLSSFGVVSGAKLVIFGKIADTQDKNLKVNLFPVANTSWTGSSLTFNNRPLPGATPLASVFVFDNVLRRYEFNVSSYVMAEKAAGRNVVSFMLQSPVVTKSVITFNSSNAAGNKPRLTVLTPPTVGIFTATTPPAHVSIEQDISEAVTWTVPVNGWRQLSAIDLRLRDVGGGSAATFRFTEAANSFSLVGATGVLAHGIALSPQKSSFHAAGPTAPAVTVTYVFHFGAAAAGHRFVLDVAARNDAGDASGFLEIGTIRV